MDTPKPGDRATKNGITAHVQFVENGEVRGIRAPMGAMERYWAQGGGHPEEVPMDLWEEPKPWASGFCMALVDWQVAVVDAVYERAA